MENVFEPLTGISVVLAMTVPVCPDAGVEDVEDFVGCVEVVAVEPLELAAGVLVVVAVEVVPDKKWLPKSPTAVTAAMAPAPTTTVIRTRRREMGALRVGLRVDALLLAMMGGVTRGGVTASGADTNNGGRAVSWGATI